MIDWKKSAGLNQCTTDELKARFQRFPKSNKKVVAVCDECGECRVMAFHSYRSLCRACAHVGLKQTDETLRKKSYVMSGNRNPMYGKSARLGKKHSDESKRKISEAAKGRKLTEEHKRKISVSGKGKTLGKKYSLNVRKRMSAAQQGIPYDEWCEFAKEQKYCPKFDEACRESCRAKYKHRCFMCDKKQADNKTKTGKVRKLSVHHVDMDKAQGCESNWKLVPLCMKCHPVTHNDEMIARLGYIIKEV